MIQMKVDINPARFLIDTYRVQVSWWVGARHINRLIDSGCSYYAHRLLEIVCSMSQNDRSPAQEIQAEAMSMP